MPGYYDSDGCYYGDHNDDNEIVAAQEMESSDDEPPCPHCHRVDCECSDFDVSPDMGAKG